MNIIVTVKQVPNTQNVRIDPETGIMDRSNAPSIMNPTDSHALEAALWLKTVLDGAASVVVLSMGPPQAENVLREALAMGADRAVLLCDPAFAGADTLATAYTLSRAIRKLGEFGIILCGHHSMDGETGQVGPQVAGYLNIPQVTHAESIDHDRGLLTISSSFERVMRIVEATPPVLITVSRNFNKPRYKTMNGILRAFREKTVDVWDRATLDLGPLRVGIHGSPTQVKRVYVPEYESRAAVHTGDPMDLAEEMVALIVNNNVAGVRN